MRRPCYQLPACLIMTILGWLKLTMPGGRRSGRKFRMGDKVFIKVVSANLSKRQLDFEWVMKPDVEDQLNEAPVRKGKAPATKGKKQEQGKEKKQKRLTFAAVRLR